MDKERRNSIDHAVRVLAGVIRSIHLKRVLHKVDAKPRLNFWCIIYGNLLDAAVLDWCMLFGSHNQKHQPLHWKNVVPQLEHNTFRDGLLCHLNVDCDHWHYYREQVKGYRDNHAAHFGMDWNRPENNPLYPDLELALQAAYYYYEKLIEISIMLNLRTIIPRILTNTVNALLLKWLKSPQEQ